MTTTLRFAPKLSLPLDAVTQRFAELGRIGSGKSYAATKLAELMYDVGAQFIALDPVGIWYGLRVDGKGKGLNIPIFGGLRGDVPLEAGGGALMADLTVERRLSCVLDVSQFESDRDKARFAGDFAKRFFFRKKAAPSAVHLFLEECQEFIPQNPQNWEGLMLHEFTRLAKLGRNFGIGLSLISQRPQEVNKKVLNLTECLLAFQMTGTHERKAIRDWVAAKGADESILDVLPSLAVGVAHVYSPQWLRISEQVKCYEKRSADVSSTPEVDVDVAPILTQPLDAKELAALHGQMAATIEKAKAEDPRELRKEIASLKRQLEQKPGKTIEKPVADERAIARAVGAASRAHEERYRILSTTHGRLVRSMGKFAGDMVAVAGGMSEVLKHYGEAITASEAEQGGTAGRPEGGVRREAAGGGLPVPRRSIPPVAPARTHVATDSSLGKTPQRMLNALRFLESIGTSPASRAAVAGLVGVSWDTGTFRNYLSDLRGAGYITDGPGTDFALTAAGRAAASDDGLPTTRGELHDTWASKLGTTPARMLRVLIEEYPDAISRDRLGNRVGIDHSTGTFRNYLSDLRSPGLMIDVDKATVRAADALFPEGLD